MNAKVKMMLQNPGLVFLSLGHRGMLNWIPDKKYLEIAYKIRLGEKPDLDHPQTFSEKIQWLKLNDRNPLYTKLVDKYEVRAYVAQKLGEEYLVPLLGGPWDSFDEIDFNALPDRFVLKCTHDSGGSVICRDKSTLDIAAAGKKINGCLKRNYFWGQREWPYKGVKPRIIAEEYMVDESGYELKDYKIHCFSGEPKLIQVDYGRFIRHERNIYTPDWTYIPMSIKYPTNKEHDIAKPERLEKMLEIARLLSQDIQYVRVDLYYLFGQVLFGEMTLHHGSGMELFDPPEWDLKLGQWLALPVDHANT